MLSFPLLRPVLTREPVRGTWANLVDGRLGAVRSDIVNVYVVNGCPLVSCTALVHMADPGVTGCSPLCGSDYRDAVQTQRRLPPLHPEVSCKERDWPACEAGLRRDDSKPDGDARTSVISQSSPCSLGFQTISLSVW
jgi:hypothetical protein